MVNGIHGILSYAQASAPAPRDEVRAEAQAGLRDSDRFYWRFWQKTELKTQAAEQALQNLARISASAGDRGTAHAVETTLVAAGQTSSHQRLTILRRGLECIEAGVAASASNQAGLAMRLLHAIDAEAGDILQRATAKTVLDEVERQSRADGAADAPYVSFLNKLVDAGASSTAAVQMLSQGTESTAQGFASKALLLGRDGTRVHQIALADIAALNDADARPHLERRDRLAGLPGMDSSATSFLDTFTLEAIRDRKPAAPEHAAAQMAAANRAMARVGAVPREAIARAVLDETAASGKATGVTADWLRFRGEAQALGVSVDLQALAGIASNQPLDVPTRAKSLETVFPRDLATAEKLVQYLESAAPQSAQSLQTFRKIASRVANDDATRLAILADAVKSLTTTPDPKKPAPPQETAIAQLAARLVGKSSNPASQLQIADACLDELARLTTNPDLTRILTAARPVLASQMAEPKQNVAFLNELLRHLQSPPADATSWTLAVDRMINSTGYHVDRLNVAHAMLPALVDVVNRGTDEVFKQRVAVTAVLAREKMFDLKSQLAAVSAGLQYAARPKAVTGSSIAHFGATLAASLTVPSDALRVANATVDVLNTRATADGDHDTADACALLKRVALIPSQEDRYQLAPVLTGLNYLGAKQTVKGDPFMAFAARLVGAVPSSYALQQAQVAEAIAEVLQARAQRRKDFDDEEQVRFLLAVSRQPFVAQDSRSLALQKGVEAIANGTATQEDGLANVALAMMTGAKYHGDQLSIAQAAIAEAVRIVDASGNQERSKILHVLQEAVALDNYEKKYQVAIAQAALKLIVRRPQPEPGELASVGLEMVNSAYYFVNTIGIGEVVLRGLEALAVLENDRVYVPALVADVRGRMQAAASEKAKIDALRAGLKEISKLKGDEFRKALVAALQTGQPENGPRVEQEEEFVIINGIKVPRSKE